MLSFLWGSLRLRASASWVEDANADTWVRPGASAIHGVGLLAVRPIPTGTVIDHRPPGVVRPQHIDSETLAGLDHDVRAFLASTVVLEANGAALVPSTGLNLWVPGMFVNHCSPGNAIRIKGDAFHNLVTVRAVALGEEVCVDYPVNYEVTPP